MITGEALQAFLEGLGRADLARARKYQTKRVPRVEAVNDSRTGHQPKVYLYIGLHGACDCPIVMTPAHAIKLAQELLGTAAALEIGESAVPGLRR